MTEVTAGVCEVDYNFNGNFTNWIRMTKSKAK